MPLENKDIARPQHEQADRAEVRPVDASDRLIVALDLPTMRDAMAMVDLLEDSCRWFKVGLELFYAAGADLVRELRRRKLHVFLDLKLHDIPNTAAAAVRALSVLDVQLLTVHASGGSAMLAAAQQAASESSEVTLLGVTVLTSMNNAQLRETGIAEDARDQVLRLARLAAGAGLAGIVCSPLEVAHVRAAIGPGASLVVPGVRLPSAPTDDQNRFASPADAITAGASMLVVGRPITRAPDPLEAATHMLEEIAAATSLCERSAP